MYIYQFGAHIQSLNARQAKQLITEILDAVPEAESIITGFVEANVSARPIVYFDVKIGSRAAQRIKFEVFEWVYLILVI